MKTIASKRPPISQMPQVLLLIESSRAYGRGCLMGIASYMRAHGAWDVMHLERGLQEEVPAIVQRHRLDGVIARMENESIARSVRTLSVPTVDLRGLFRPDGGVTYDTDPDACAQLTLEHFRQRGFRHLGYCGYRGVDFSDRRRDAFQQRCADEGIGVDVFDQPFRQSKDIDGRTVEDTLGCEAEGELSEKELSRWLLRLPKPVGIFACNDIRGRQVIGAAHKAGLRIPDQVAVLGVDDDEVICDLANPPLSSIEPDTYRMGFEGAGALTSLMAGEIPDREMVMIPPLRITVRRSTDVLAVEDPELAMAIEFIRTHACNGIGVEDVLRTTIVSRATLERRFRKVLGRSPREEIERVRIDRVRMLLAETTYSLDKIAAMTGYKTAAHLVTAFRRNVNCTPGQYRRQFSQSCP